MSSSSRLRDAQAMIEEEVAHWPGATVTWSLTNNGHAAASLTFANQTRKLFVSTTSGDWRSAQNNISIARRLLRGLGAARDAKPDRNDEHTSASAARDSYRPPAPTYSDKSFKVSDDLKVAPKPDLADQLRVVRANQIATILKRWQDTQLNEARIDEAARMLLENWHPDIIERAIELIDESFEIRESQQRDRPAHANNG